MLSLARVSKHTLRCRQLWRFMYTAKTSAVPAAHRHLLIDPTPAGFQEAGEMLRAGNLVAFPTETVYGLGADAFNDEAVRSVFAAKGRPWTDPLIVHVLQGDSEEIRSLVDMSAAETRIFNSLAELFWPGPLTMIVPASAKVPSSVTAGTGKVGIRVPAHPMARSLLEAALCPIAAPSANRFGHISPTHSSHVLSDLGDKSVHVLNGEFYHTNGIGDDTAEQQQQQQQQFSCEYGIESTVIEIDGSMSTVNIYRHGAVAASQLCSVLKNLSLRAEAESSDWEEWEVHTPGLKKATLGSKGEVSPGQCITHYAPNLPCYVAQELTPENGINSKTLEESEISQTIVLDFQGKLHSLSNKALGYKDLSETGSCKEAAKRIFDYLRWAELQEGAHNVLIAQAEELSDDNEDFIASGLRDRILRASSAQLRNVSF